MKRLNNFALAAILAGIPIAQSQAAPAETGDRRNLALAGYATQSSEYQGKSADRANDGITNGRYSGDSIAMTSRESEAWWQLDLNSVKSLNEINVFFRSDNCCGSRNDNINLYFANFDMSGMSNAELQSNPGVKHYSYTNTPAELSQQLDIQSRYVMIKQQGTEYLEIAEVELFNDETLPPLETQKFLDRNRYGMFIHYNMSTYSGAQWASPNANPRAFNPSNLDTDQWAKVAADAGMTYAVLTAKHHDGFSIWDTDLNDHNSMVSPCNCDVVEQYMKSFRAAGVEPSIYFSIWDKYEGYVPDPQDKTYRGNTAWKQNPRYLKNQLRELLTRYGTIPLLWFDGWGTFADYKYVEFQGMRDFIRHVSPTTLIVNNDRIRNHETKDIISFEEGGPMKEVDSTHPLTQGLKWMYSARASNIWFSYGSSGIPKHDEIIAKSVDALRESPNGTYLLNVGPTTHGTIPQVHIDQLQSVKKLAKQMEISDSWIPGKNIAQNKSTSQSSTNGGMKSTKAVDGEKSGRATFLVNGQRTNKGSLAHTNSDQHPWWQVDLGNSEHVDEIRVWTRLDSCCETRLGTIAVHWSDSPITGNLWDNQGNVNVTENVQVIDTTDQVAVRVPVNGPARYVRVERQDAGYLELSEVEVLQFERSLTKGATASQSSTAYGGVAQRAIDQNISGNYASRSVTHTGEEDSPWWEVDLGDVKEIDNIGIHNRIDGQLGKRLSDVYILTSESSMQGRSLDDLLADSEVTQFYKDQVLNEWTVDTTAPARYVRVQKASPGFLSLAEVSVVGRPEIGNNLALNRDAYQISTNGGNDASRAVNGNTDGKTSAITTGVDAPWWYVDLGTSKRVSKVTIYNRRSDPTMLDSAYVLLFDQLPDLDGSMVNNINKAKRAFRINVADDIEELHLPGHLARYVVIQKESSRPLALSEIVVE